MRWTLLALLFQLPNAGCDRVRPCAALTLLVTVSFDSTTAQADQLAIEVSVDDAPAISTLESHQPGATSGTLEIDFPHGYLPGHTATVEIRASQSGALLGVARDHTLLPPKCGTLQLTLTPSPSDTDASVD